MRKLILFTVISLLSLCTVVTAADVVTGFGVGYILQQNEKGDLGYYVSFGFPTVTDTADGYKIVTRLTTLYSNRTLDGINEIEAARALLEGQKYLYNTFYASLGVGSWYLVNTDGDNAANLALSIGLGYETKGMDFTLGMDVLPVKDGPDIYYPNLSLRLLKF